VSRLIGQMWVALCTLRHHALCFISRLLHIINLPQGMPQ